eukprot:1846066-Pyramimonas_sp.AAC.1
MVLAGIRPERSLENPEAPVVRGPTEVHEALAAYWGEGFPLQIGRQKQNRGSPGQSLPVGPR